MVNGSLQNIQNYNIDITVFWKALQLDKILASKKMVFYELYIQYSLFKDFKEWKKFLKTILTRKFSTGNVETAVATVAACLQRSGAIEFN